MSVRDKLSKSKAPTGVVEVALATLEHDERQAFLDAANATNQEYSNAELRRILIEESGQSVGETTFRRWRVSL